VHNNNNNYQPDTNTNPFPNPNPNPTTKQHAIVNIQLNIVTRPTYQEKFIRDMLLHCLILSSVCFINSHT